MNLSTFKILSIFILLINVSSVDATQTPKANPAAIVSFGNARFTVLTPELIRMEWSEDAKFEDRASLIFINRNLNVPEFDFKKSKDKLIIHTKALTLRYVNNNKQFSEGNLSIEYKLNNQTRKWNPAVPDVGNLRGTASSLDGYDGDILTYWKTKLDLQAGVISRDGFVVVKDSAGIVFDGDKHENWPVRQEINKSQDWYFFGYGHNYKKAIFDFTQLAGKIPLPPRYVFGYWWSRWWRYSDTEVREFWKEMKDNNIPLDVFILDMDWHTTYEGDLKKDPFGHKLNWGSYNWNKGLFPQPDSLFSFFKKNNIKSALNLHPASGVSPNEERYAEVAKAMNLDTSKPIPFDKAYAKMCQKEFHEWDTTSTHGYIPCDFADKKFVNAYFNILLRPIEKQGVNFWWLDWQQQKWTRTKNLNNIWWINHLHFTDMEKNKDTRPLVFHRYGGLGSHRYPIGFSGDALVSWKTLKFQPYFTSTAANIGYSYWSNDIGGNGHYGVDSIKKNFLDDELFTRWFQFGVLSPVLRTHASRSPEQERRIWMFKDPYRKALRKSLNMRYELAPYIYNSARLTYDSALAICLPMYYEHPDKNEAYNYPNQYYFGREIIAAPVTAKMNQSGIAESKIWLPKGTWFEWHSGTLLKGDSVYNRKFTINDIPVYVKSGAVLPLNLNAKNLSVTKDTVVWAIFPGSTNGSGYLYEDNGDSKAYINGEYTITKLNYSIDPQGKMKIKIEPAKGNFDGKLLQRTYIIRLVNTLPVNRVLVNEGILDLHASSSYLYNAFTLSNEINIGKVDVNTSTVVEIQTDKRQTTELMNGVVGKMSRLNELIIDFKPYLGFGGMFPLVVSNAEQMPMRIQYNLQSAYNELTNFSDRYDQIYSVLCNMWIEKQEKERLTKKATAYK